MKTCSACPVGQREQGSGADAREGARPGLPRRKAPRASESGGIDVLSTEASPAKGKRALTRSFFVGPEVSEGSSGEA